MSKGDKIAMIVLGCITIFMLGMIIGGELMRWRMTSQVEEPEPVKYEETLYFDIQAPWEDTRPVQEVGILYLEDYPDYQLLAQLIQAEAGNQCLQGQRYVADVVLNRVESERFPDTIEDVIQSPGQFAVMTDGGWERAQNAITGQAYMAAAMEMGGTRLNEDIYWFGRDPRIGYGRNWFRLQDHWFGE